MTFVRLRQISRVMEQVQLHGPIAVAGPTTVHPSFDRARLTTDCSLTTVRVHGPCM